MKTNQKSSSSSKSPSVKMRSSSGPGSSFNPPKQSSAPKSNAFKPVSTPRPSLGAPLSTSARNDIFKPLKPPPIKNVHYDPLKKKTMPGAFSWMQTLTWMFAREVVKFLIGDINSASAQRKRDKAVMNRLREELQDNRSKANRTRRQEAKMGRYQKSVKQGTRRGSTNLQRPIGVYGSTSYKVSKRAYQPVRLKRH